MKKPTKKKAAKAPSKARIRTTTDDAKNSAVDSTNLGHKPFGDVGMHKAIQQAIEQIEALQTIARLSLEHCNPYFAKLRFDASTLLADVAALFIRQWPSKEQVTTAIWEIHRDKESGFRQRWDSIRKTTKGDDPFVDDFASGIWTSGWVNEPEKMRQNQTDIETLWTKVLEPIGRKYWPRWISEDYINRYYPNVNDRYEALNVTGWTKGKWNEKVKTAIKILARRKAYLDEAR